MMHFLLVFFQLENLSLSPSTGSLSESLPIKTAVFLNSSLSMPLENIFLLLSKDLATQSVDEAL